MSQNNEMKKGDEMKDQREREMSQNKGDEMKKDQNKLGRVRSRGRRDEAGSEGDEMNQ